jgi:RNA polymerase sigma-70 factor, ECF subfamily
MKEKIIPIQRLRDRDSNPMSDQAIAAACGTGDGAAITILFNRFQIRITRFVQRLNGTKNLQDLVQSTFVEVVRGNTVYDGRASVTTWLFAIATNIVRNSRRSFFRRNRLNAALMKEPRHEIQSAGELLDNVRKIERANESLSSLSDSQREAFVLFVLEGLSAKEAALTMGTSESAVWKLVCKARANLRRKVLEE